MKQIRKKRVTTWYDRWGGEIAYRTHPGALLAAYTQWARPPTNRAAMSSPEPDVVNVAVMSTKMIDLKTEHVYFYRDGDRWISFGRSDDPDKTIADIKDIWQARWINHEAREPREWIVFGEPTYMLANEMPEESRWQWIEQVAPE